MLMMIVGQESDRGVLTDLENCRQPWKPEQGEEVLPSRSPLDSSTRYWSDTDTDEENHGSLSSAGLWIGTMKPPRC